MRARLPVVLSLLAFGLAACGRPDDNVVNIYNWADYIDPDVIDMFEAETAIQVNYNYYDSSGIVDVKLLAGSSGYDVVAHSNQYASRLTPIGIFEKLDMSKLPNAANHDPAVYSSIDLFEKVRGYMVPYHWGTTGFGWNADMVRERLPNHPMDSADVLFDPDVVAKLADCGVTLLDDPTSIFPMVLAYLGREPNAFDDESLGAAEAQLKKVRPYIRYYSNDKYLSDLPNREICVAMSWSGDYAQAARRAIEAGIDIDLRYTVPREGSVLWVDGWYIPSDAPHRDNAYAFIDFMMRADIAARNSTFTNYANANGASWELLPPELLADPAVYPDAETWERAFPIVSVPPKRERPRTRAFARAKSGL